MDWKPYTKITPFPWWAHKVLPLVYDESLSYYELLCKVVAYLNEMLKDVSNLETNVDELRTAFDELQAYVNNYFQNLSIQNEVNNKIDQLVNAGLMEGWLNAAAIPDHDNLLDTVSGSGVIGCIGDSITYGYNPTTDAQHTYPYPALLQSILREYYDTDTITVHNYGVNGASSNAWLTQYNQAKADDCNIMIFMFGHNDFRLESGLDNVLEHITEFIHKCITDGITPVVCSVPAYYGTTEWRLLNMDQISQAIKTVTLSNNAIYCPLYETLNTMLECGAFQILTLLPDGVHFTDYHLIADIIASTIFTQATETPYGNVITAWRCSGLTMENVEIATGPEVSNNGRVISIAPSSVYKLRFFSEKPFKLYSITSDDSYSGVVTWNISNDGVAEQFTHDYYVQGADFTYQFITQIQNKVYKPGRYVLSVASINPHTIDQLISRCYLCGIIIEPQPYLLTNLEP